MKKTKTDNAPSAAGTVADYSFSETPKATNKKTIVEGHEPEISENPHEQLNVLAGFLVSYSKKDTGEFWPLREGNNAIGQSPENDVILGEKHVSAKHANINVSKDSENDRWKFQLVDLSSTNGTELNSQRLPIYSGVEIETNDKLKIGEYVLMLFATDKFLHQLSKNEKFQTPASQAVSYDSRDYFSSSSDATRADY